MTRLMQVTILGTVFSMAGVAQAAPSSGMLLGVYAFSNWQGLRITGTIPGYSAHGKLYKNDVLLRASLFETIELGTPFMTTGCAGTDGQVACNRPFGNCLPDDKQWNYPYPPNEEELALIQGRLFQMDSSKKPLT